MQVEIQGVLIWILLSAPDPSQGKTLDQKIIDLYNNQQQYQQQDTHVLL